jgi:hypothetical protein
MPAAPAPRWSPSALAWVTAGLWALSGPLGLVLGEAAAFRNVHYVLAAALGALAFVAPATFAQPLSRPSRRALFGGALLWLGFASWSHWASFHVNGVDFSIFDWMLESTHQGRFGYSPIYDVDHFGVHSSFLLLLLVPLHALWATPLWLVATGPLVLWAGLFPLRRLSRALVGVNGGLELTLSLAWLGNAWLGRLANGVFRIESLAPALTLWFLVGWVERRRGVWALATLALFCAKEDTALALGCFSAVMLAVERDRRRDAGALLVAALTFFFAYTRLLQPWLTQHAQPPYWHFWSDFGDTPGAIATTLITSPKLVLGKLLSARWWFFFGPLLLLPFGSWRAVGGLWPTFFLLGVANYDEMHLYRSYYPSPMVAWALLGTLSMLARWQTQPGRWRWGLLALLLFPLVEGGYAKAVPVDFGRRAGLEAVAAALARPATQRCLQTVLMPQVGYPEHPQPLMDVACIDDPGAVGLLHPALDRYPLEDGPAYDAAVARWRSEGRVEELPGGFLYIRAR